ncbi:MAG TPA: c-type cytochrome [Sphingomicrobium sp.]|jgi:cytochrome c|nr:c-type cytochrome [Sphingomicrobium sp.]
MRCAYSIALWSAGVVAAVTAATFTLPRPGFAADDVSAGQALYQGKCTGCHSVDADRIGPRHRNVVGRKVASVPGYDYSPALKKLGGIWTPARLDQWLSGTQKMAPGSKMYLEIDDPTQRRLLIAYLKSVSKPH